MNNKKRSAFTIVELVIVIAVIAILSAVLIPTFGAIIKDANVAADQTAAASLTTELHIHLKGNTIDSEEELVDALRESGVGEKLVPKALAYGYHFWFDMETQMFVANTAEEIVDARDPYEGSAASGMRNIYNNGYYLADSDSVIANMFGNMADITAATYASYFANVEAAKNDDNYGAIAEKVLENLKSTIIVNNNGIFFYTANTRALTNNSVWFAPGIKVVSADHYEYDGSEVKAATTLPGVVNGKVNLPSSVLLVEANALDFADPSTEIITNYKDYNGIALIFAPKSTNAIVVDANGNKYIVTTGPKGGVANKEDGTPVPVSEYTDVLHVYPSDGVDNPWVKDLVKKLPFEDYEIGYDVESNLVAENGTVEDKVLYISTLKNGIIQLYAKNGDEKSYSVEYWESDNDAISIKNGVLTFDYAGIMNRNDATITATAYNLNNVEITETLKIVVVAPTQASISIAGLSAPIPLDGNTHHVGFNLTQNNQTVNVSINGITYNDGYGLRYDGDNGLLSTVLAINTPNNSKLTATGNELSFTNIGTGDYTFNVSVDGCLETTVVIDMVDLLDAPFQPSFHHQEDKDRRPYYVGTEGEVLISDLFNWTRNKAFTTARVTVFAYTELNGVLDPINEINNVYENAGGTIKATYSESFTYSDWENGRASIKFTLNAEYDVEDYELVVMIVPDNDTAMLLNLTFADGAINVNTIEKLDQLLTNNGTETPDIVLNTDLIHSDETPIANSVKLEVVGSTLYGNGYIIRADKYVAEIIHSNKTETNTNQWCSMCERHIDDCIGDINPETKEPSGGHGYHWKVTAGGCDSAATYNKEPYIVSKEVTSDHYHTDVAFITLNDGVIDNIYLDGPVYPDLQYYENECVLHCATPHASKQYYVSGIKALGNSTIQNSYVAGFRQPIKAAGNNVVINRTETGTVSETPAETTTITGTTVHGGNYANIVLATGHLVLENVTTIQELGGEVDTFGGTAKIIGLGIMVEDTALRKGNFTTNKDKTITIKGYLNQYNWVEKNDNKKATLPTVMGINLTELFPNLFNTTIISSTEKYLHEVGSGDYKGSYINTGIMCMILNPEIYDDYLESPYTDVFESDANGDKTVDKSYNEHVAYVNNAFNIDDQRNGTGTDEFTYRNYEKTPMPSFRHKILSSNTILQGIIQGVVSAMGVDIDKVDVQITMTGPKVADGITLGTDGYPLEYNGYYSNYGK